MSWTETIERYLREGRTVSGGKGGDTANAQREQELQMQQEAFQMQQQQLQALQKAFSGYLSGNLGFSPQLLAGMRSQFLNQNTANFNQAGQQVRAALGARGSGTGQLPVGGDYTRGIAGLMGAKASSQAQGILGLNVQNAQQALQNQFNAGNLLSGNAATLTGTQGVAGNAASSALQSYITAQNQPGFLRSFGTGLGGALGGAITGGAGGALSGFLSGASAPTDQSWMPNNPVMGQPYYPGAAPTGSSGLFGSVPGGR